MENFFFDVYKAENFTSAMAWRGEVGNLNCSIDALNLVLTSSITNVARELGMIKKNLVFLKKLAKNLG